jgi:hypothetical protein
MVILPAVDQDEEVRSRNGVNNTTQGQRKHTGEFKLSSQTPASEESDEEPIGREKQSGVLVFE